MASIDLSRDPFSCLLSMTLLNVAAMTVAEIWGNTHFKWYTTHKRWDLFWKGVLGYLGVIYFLVQSLAAQDMLWVTAMWEGMITVMGAGASVFILGESFNHWIQWVGLSLGVVAMGMVHIGEHL